MREPEKPDEKQPDPSVEAGRHDLQEQVRVRLAKMNVKQQKSSHSIILNTSVQGHSEIMSITESRVCQIHTEAVYPCADISNELKNKGFNRR